MNMPPIVSSREWEAARRELLVKEKELTHARDALAAERAQAPLELRALDGVGGECDRTPVRMRGVVGFARAAQQLGVRRVQRLVALERRIVEQRLEQLQPGGRA